MDQKEGESGEESKRVTEERTRTWYRYLDKKRELRSNQWDCVRKILVGVSATHKGLTERGLGCSLKERGDFSVKSQKLSHQKTTNSYSVYYTNQKVLRFSKTKMVLYKGYYIIMYYIRNDFIIKSSH